MAYTLSNKCAKNLSKRTVLLQLIIKNVVTCFFLEHSVYTQVTGGTVRYTRGFLHYASILHRTASVFRSTKTSQKKSRQAILYFPQIRKRRWRLGGAVRCVAFGLRRRNDGNHALISLKRC